MDSLSPPLTPLAELQVFLHQAGYSTWLSPASADEPAEALLVDLNDEPSAQPWVARLLWLDALEAALAARAGRAPEPADDVRHLECLIRLPLDPGARLAEVRLLAQWLSAQLPFGVYLCDAAQGLCFRHVLLSEDPGALRLLVVEVLELCLPALRAHASRFAAVAAGKSDAREALSGGKQP